MGPGHSADFTSMNPEQWKLMLRPPMMEPPKSLVVLFLYPIDQYAQSVSQMCLMSAQCVEARPLSAIRANDFSEVLARGSVAVKFDPGFSSSSPPGRTGASDWTPPAPPVVQRDAAPEPSTQ
ncbi:unnamed protein product [Pleuronectes platessa]|uniref:Uncharacterized protein n=1 Tax=Pleuronectes platessa TaxID=8262 RepID=A0A9N7VR68_PLEPL|nr:unnamed protein product [Pleuronectes platessa]